jgi:hypothetical protein
VGRPKDVVPPTKVDGGSTAATAWDHAAGLSEECRPGGTLAKRPQKVLTRAPCSSPPPCEHVRHPPA